MSLGFRLKRLYQIIEILRHGVLRLPGAETLHAVFGSVGAPMKRPCTPSTRTYQEGMDRPTFEALKRIMERIGLRAVAHTGLLNILNLGIGVSTQM